jgi:hypothetical protein
MTTEASQTIQQIFDENATETSTETRREYDAYNDRFSDYALSYWTERWHPPFKEFAQKIERNVRVQLFSTTNTPLMIDVESLPSQSTDPQEILFCLNAAPIGDSMATHSRTSIFGTPLTDGASNFYGPSNIPDAIPIYDDELNFVGEILKAQRKIMIPWALTRATNSYNTLIPLTRYMLDRIVMIFTDVDGYAQHLENQKGILAERAKQRFIELCSGRTNRQLATYENSLQGNEENLRYFYSEIIRINRDSNEISALITALGTIKVDEKKIEAEWNAINSHELVESISCVMDHSRNTENFVITTKPLISKELPDGTTRFLGVFEITFNIAENRLPSVRNLTQQINEWQHPHIPSNGEVCWGNMAESITNLVSSYEFGLAIQLVIRFLVEPYEEDMWGVKIYDWPINSQKEGMPPRRASEICGGCNEVFGECECFRCEICDETDDNCECYRCDSCSEIYQTYDGDRIDNCGCNRCDNCSELVTDCLRRGSCNRCQNCERLPDDCECIHCENCEEIMEEETRDGLCNDCREEPQEEEDVVEPLEGQSNFSTLNESTTITTTTA